MDDTICSIATSLGIGAISIIRVSGKEAIKIVNQIFKGKNLEKVNSHTINYGYIVNKEEIIDVAGNITTIPSKNYSFTIKDKEIKFCFKKENKCLTTTCIVKGNLVTLGDLKDESLSGTFKKTTTNDGIILEKELSNDTIIKYYYIKRQG